MGKHFSREKRRQIVKEAMAGIKVGTLARMYGVHPDLEKAAWKGCSLF
ncbi:hypothetical protein J27TS7_48620 [Paenibacillus dendritiformis]|nr:hypothetical protein [Paenibacillus dendritiformis]GIO75348.1 hypothetical protein J27TS7_48620 [Paenibacillus dendritiformis]